MSICDLLNNVEIQGCVKIQYWDNEKPNVVFEGGDGIRSEITYMFAEERIDYYNPASVLVIEIENPYEESEE